MTIAREWAAYCQRTASAALPAEVEARARLCLADHLHAAMHGARSHTATMLRRYSGWEQSMVSSALGAESAALYAGAVSAVHEIDDVHQDTSLHAGSAVVAAAMAAAAENDVPGSRLLAAIAAGYEVAVRLSVASGHRHYHYFHATATCGTVGAAAAAAVVIGLDEERYPFCLGCFEPLEGLRHLLAALVRKPSDITSMLIETSPPTAWMVGQPNPQDEFQAKFSAQYALALVLAGHDVERAPLPAELLTDPEVRRWIALIRVEGNREFRRRRARVTVTLQDGTRESADQPFRNLGDDEAWARFARACRRYLGERGAILERHVDACAGLSGMAELMLLVRAAILPGPMLAV